MALDTVIDAARLTRLGITGAMATLLTGKTISQAADTFLEDLVILIGIHGTTRPATISYSVDGQAVNFSYSELERLVAFLRQSRTSGGPQSMPVRFA